MAHEQHFLYTIAIHVFTQRLETIINLFHFVYAYTAHPCGTSHAATNLSLRGWVSVLACWSLRYKCKPEFWCYNNSLLHGPLAYAKMMITMFLFTGVHHQYLTFCLIYLSRHPMYIQLSQLMGQTKVEIWLRSLGNSSYHRQWNLVSIYKTMENVPLKGK